MRRVIVGALCSLLFLTLFNPIYGDLRFELGNWTIRDWKPVPFQMVACQPRPGEAHAYPTLPGAKFPCVTTTPPPAHVQSAESAAVTTPTGAATFTTAVVTGHLVVGVASYSNTCTLGTITDDKGNTYTQPVGGTGTDTTEGQKSTAFYLANVTGGPKTVTENVTGASCSSSVIIGEYIMSPATTALDQITVNFQNSPGTGANAITSGPVTTTQNGELIYCVNNIVGGATTITAGTGFTLRKTQTGLQDNLSAEDQVQATAGAIACLFTTGSNQDTLTNIMTFHQ